MTHKPAHKPAGIPEGGQFTATAHAEPTLNLTGESRFDVVAHAELNDGIRAENARIEESKRKLSRMHVDAALALIRKDFPTAAVLELDFSSSFGMNARVVRDRDGKVLTEGTSWIYSGPGNGPYLCSHLDAIQQSLFYDEGPGYSHDGEAGSLLVDVDHRFSTPAEPANETPAPMTREQVQEYAAGQISHHISPVIGWIRRDGAAGKDTAGYLKDFREGVNRAAGDIAGRLQPGPAPVLDGFTAADVEDYLAREQHQRQCGCDLKDDVCATESYGENWRYRMGVPDVEGIYDTLQEMAAARKE